MTPIPEDEPLSPHDTPGKTPDLRDPVTQAARRRELRDDMLSLSAQFLSSAQRNGYIADEARERSGLLIAAANAVTGFPIP